MKEYTKEELDDMDKFKGVYTEKQRTELIKKELARLSKSLKDLDEDKKITLNKLFNEAAFMAVTLEETRLIIVRDGTIETYQNGANQHGIKKSAAVEVYDRMVNTYTKVLEQINKAMPEGKKVDAGEELLKFALSKK